MTQLTFHRSTAFAWLVALSACGSTSSQEPSQPPPQQATQPPPQQATQPPPQEPLAAEAPAPAEQAPTTEGAVAPEAPATTGSPTTTGPTCATLGGTCTSRFATVACAQWHDTPDCTRASEGCCVTTAPPPGARRTTFNVVTESDQQGPTGPARGPVTLRAAPALNAIQVDVGNLTTYCEPTPSFSATVDGQTLRLVLVPPSMPSRCFAPHTLRLRVEVPGRNNVRRVVLARDAGTELASAPVSSSRSG